MSISPEADHSVPPDATDSVKAAASITNGLHVEELRIYAHD